MCGSPYEIWVGTVGTQTDMQFTRIITINIFIHFPSLGHLKKSAMLQIVWLVLLATFFIQALMFIDKYIQACPQSLIFFRDNH